MISIFRKIFYDTPGFNDRLIPGSAHVPGYYPQTLNREREHITVEHSLGNFDHIDEEYYPCEFINGVCLRPEIYLNQQVALNNGLYIDMGHVFAGLDAINYPIGDNGVYVVNILPYLRIESNADAATWLGDIAGSLAYAYIEGYNSKTCRFPASLTITKEQFQQAIDKSSPAVDILGDIAPFVIASTYQIGACGDGPKVSEILEHYYLGIPNIRFNFSGIDIQNHKYSIFSTVSDFNCMRIDEYKDQVADAAAFFLAAGAKLTDFQNEINNGKVAALTLALELQGTKGNAVAETLLKLFCKELERLIMLEP